MLASAASLFRSRIEGFALLTALLPALACGGADTSRAGQDAIAVVAGVPLAAVQVKEVEAREGIGEEAALASALDTLRLAAARREELGEAAELDPVRDANLRASALVRAYLRDVFEPEHGPAKMSDKFLAQNIVPPQRAARHFHPRLHALCQVIVIPKQSKEKDAKPVLAPKDDEQWWTDAHGLLDPIVHRMRQWEPDFAGEKQCSLVFTAASLGRMESEDGELLIKTEGGMFEVDRKDLWSDVWVDALLAAKPKSFVGPFRTEFGIHFVYVLDIMQDTLVVPHNSEEDVRIPAESEAFREIGLDEWRAVEAFPNHIRDLRERHLVRLSEAGPGAPGPQ